MYIHMYIMLLSKRAFRQYCPSDQVLTSIAFIDITEAYIPSGSLMHGSFIQWVGFIHYNISNLLYTGAVSMAKGAIHINTHVHIILHM